MKAAIMICYGRPHPGREKLAFEVFGEALAFFGGKATAGVCEAPVGYMGSSGGGTIVIGGERPSLTDLTASEEYQRLFLKAGYCVPDLSWEIMAAGDAAVAMMGLWATVGSELGFM